MSQVRRAVADRHAKRSNRYRPFALTFAMPFNSTLTMTRLELCQFAIKIILRIGGHHRVGHDNDPIFSDLKPRDNHPSLCRREERTSHIRDFKCATFP